MHILILSLHYSPDLGPSAPLYTMLSEGLIKRGHQVTVLTAVPHYPSGRVQDVYRTKFIQRSMENGVQVIRVRVPSIKRSNLAMRLLQFFCFQVGATWAGLNLQYDAVIVANPALSTWLPFFTLVVLKRKPAIFSVHDVYPDVGVTLGVFRNKFIISLVGALERYCLKHAFLVRILSESFGPGVLRQGVPAEKIALIYDWVDTDLIRPMSRCNSFTAKNNLQDQFVVLYAGNLGFSQGLEIVLAAAAELASYPNVRFLFVGDGSGREALVKRAQQQSLANVQFLPFQSRECLPEVLASANVSLVVLRKGIGTGSLPSKTFSILASGRPVIASVDVGSETWNLIQKANAGLCIEPEDSAKLTAAILKLRNDMKLCDELGKMGRAWAEQEHSPQSAVLKFEELLQKSISA
jgi:colanic acid biosynthesis glycosyl transferase WcaI